MIEGVSSTPYREKVHDKLSEAIAETIRDAQKELDEMSGGARGQYSDAQRDAMSRFINETMPAAFGRLDPTVGNERAFFLDPVHGNEYGVVARVNPNKREMTRRDELEGYVIIIISLVIGIIILWAMAKWIF